MRIPLGAPWKLTRNRLEKEVLQQRWFPSREFVEQHLGLLEVGGVESPVEPVIDPSQQLAGLRLLALCCCHRQLRLMPPPSLQRLRFLILKPVSVLSLTFQSHRTVRYLSMNTFGVRTSRFGKNLKKSRGLVVRSRPE